MTIKKRRSLLVAIIVLVVVIGYFYYGKTQDHIEKPDFTKLPIVNVSAFGADANGSTDSSRAFQKAIDSLIDGGTVQVPKGTYQVKNVVIKSNTQLIGEGANSLLKLPSSSKVWDMVLITGGNVKAENVIISDLAIDGSADEIGLRDVQMHGLDIQGGSMFVQVNRVHFRNTSGDGIRMTEDGDIGTVPQFISIDGSTFTQAGRQDIAVVHAYDVTVTNSTGTGSLDIEPEKPLVKRVTVTDSNFGRLDAASADRAAQIIVKNSHFQDSLLWNLNGMHIEKSTFRFMRVSSAVDVTLQNNSFKMLEVFPPSGKVSRNLTITGNQIDNTTQDGKPAVVGTADEAGVGLYMWNTRDTVVSENTIRAESVGVFLSTGNAQITLENNKVEQLQGTLTSKYGLYAVEKVNGLKITQNSFIGWSNGVSTKNTELPIDKLLAVNTIQK
ncbi:right-handed parallel beta-helix repeat-containing protein [Paenibacillus sp. N1-5-1-14]|uniref:glycosyl hydrolase family 28-related protein n=1 Tax=Paenibacillus radicibacter TaxID=2972488 RepID=UPI00215994F9|nr:right-handed parallel beta-helix repeat-containing protein [Paenibacillus radicibacter]MCR8641074.1 right-handed parallel beta-helix repeat-containing protein [Paenibacillus radicibacter]